MDRRCELRKKTFCECVQLAVSLHARFTLSGLSEHTAHPPPLGYIRKQALSQTNKKNDAVTPWEQLLVLLMFW